jgi:hypothetical protein
MAMAGDFATPGRRDVAARPARRRAGGIVALTPGIPVLSLNVVLQRSVVDH